MTNIPENNQNPMLAAALQYVRRGWRVFPVYKPITHADGTVVCSCRSRLRKGKCKPGKHPRLRKWTERATTRADRLRRWWREHPDSNIGIATGWLSNLIVLDVDAGQGFEHLREWEKQGKHLPKTVTVRTGSGGRQYYFRFPDLNFDPVSESKLCDFQDIDVRADGGQVVAPPSLHASGNRYAWVDGCSPEDMDVADPPDWLVDMLRQDGKPLTERRTSRHEPVVTETRMPEAHMRHLHPHLAERLVHTKDGGVRRSLGGGFTNWWKKTPQEFATERRLIHAMQSMWLPPEVRPAHDPDDDLPERESYILDYQKLRPGAVVPTGVSGGRWTNDGYRSSPDDSIAKDTVMLNVLLGESRLLVPWDHRTNMWGETTERLALDTVLIPVTVWHDVREPADLWDVNSEDRQRLLAPITEAVGTLLRKCGDPPTVSFWAEGENVNGGAIGRRLAA
jgi:hypothetical protein